ncbi:UDP-N-acetylmuramate dehydrogenase [Candidatus Microgenomates bacterium]|nr:UDP-N-acetylmuramate dehydrogenase [Candidatus Microgenomates bacterium]
MDLLPYNTFRVSAQAKEFLAIKSLDQLTNLPKDLPFLLLGGGANILFVHDFPGLVIKNELSGKNVVGEDDESVQIKVASGENWLELVTWTVENGWSGIENMAFIPGTVGAAAAGNIAAYGGNFEDVFESATAIELTTGQAQELSKKEMEFGYRESVFSRKLKNQFLVTAVTIKLSKQAHFDTSYHSRYESLATTLSKYGPGPYSPKQIAEAVTELRLTKLPDWRQVGTAGSFFKNPIVAHEKAEELKKGISELQTYPAEKLIYSDQPTGDLIKIPAGRLLDELGWKGKRIGNVGTWEKHALTVVNYGGATGQEILDFTNQMKEDIKSHFDIELEAEVNII